MTKLYYRNDRNTIFAPERERLLSLTHEYKSISAWVNEDTGEIREYYPNINFDRREERRLEKEENHKSYARKLETTLGEEAYFYTLNLHDLHKAWGKYDTIFHKERTGKVKNRVKEIVRGGFMANLEISSYSGAHSHIICGKQDSKYLKAERPCYDYFGAVQYMMKSPISIKDKYRNPEEYDLMTGVYLDMKAKSQSGRLPRRVFYRLS